MSPKPTIPTWNPPVLSFEDETLRKAGIVVEPDNRFAQFFADQLVQEIANQIDKELIENFSKGLKR